MSNSIYGEDIAVLKDQMKDVKDTLVRIETKLDTGATTYATKQELRSFKWITVPVVIIVTAVLTGLVYFYLSHGKTVSPESSGTTTVTNTTTSTPGTSGSSSSGTPATTSTATAHSDAAQPADSQTSNGGLQVALPKVTP